MDERETSSWFFLLHLYLSLAHAEEQNPPKNNNPYNDNNNNSDAPAEAVLAAEEEDVVEDFEPIERLQEVGIAAREFFCLVLVVGRAAFSNRRRPCLRFSLRRPAQCSRRPTLADHNRALPSSLLDHSQQPLHENPPIKNMRRQQKTKRPPVNRKHAKPKKRKRQQKTIIPSRHQALQGGRVPHGPVGAHGHAQDAG